jgi:hypothetical protein
MTDLLHGLEATLSFGGTPIGGYLENVSAEYLNELAEARRLGSAAVERLPGLEDCRFTANGPWEETVLGAALWTHKKAKTTAELIFSPDGGTTSYTTDVLLGTLNITAASNGMVNFSVQISGAGETERT